MVGYQAHCDDEREGLFLFNHACNTTLSLKAGDFLDLYSGPMFEDRLFKTDQCGGTLLRQEDLQPCSREMRMRLCSRSHPGHSPLAQEGRDQGSLTPRMCRRWPAGSYQFQIAFAL